jgi:hypothetical protein
MRRNGHRGPKSTRGAVLALLLLASCTPDFEESWRVLDLRILAIQAEPAEVLASRSTTALPPVQITALAVDPRAPGGEVDWELWACTPEGDTCEDAVQRVLIKKDRTTLDQIQASYTIGQDLLLAAIQNDTLRGFGGSVPVMVHLKITGSAGSDEGIKRLVYSLHEWPTVQPPAEGTLSGACRGAGAACDEGLICDASNVCRRTPNLNPTITDVTADEKPIPDPFAVKPEQEIILEPASPTADKETYWVFTFEGGTKQLEEYLTYSFFVTSGDLSNPVTGGKPSPFLTKKKVDDLTSTWTTDKEATGATVWIVVRDDRGGVSWVSYPATVAP